MKNSIYRLCDLPLKGGDVYKFVYSVSVFTVCLRADLNFPVKNIIRSFLHFLSVFFSSEVPLL